MKIAYLILTHKDPLLTARLAKKLTAGTENHIFIHVDANSDITGFQKALQDVERIHFVQRVPVYWAGYNSIEATINLFRESSSFEYFDRYVILQGMDYPICSNHEIDEFFTHNPDVEFIRAICESDGPKSQWHKYLLHYYMDNPNMWKKFVSSFNSKFGRRLQSLYHSPYVKIDGKKYSIYRGWAHFAITDELVHYLLEFHDTHPEYNQFFHHVFAADESYFHTIVYNSSFAAKTPEKGPLDWHNGFAQLFNVTYFEYNQSVRLFLSPEDYPYLKDTGYLFFRKVCTASRKLLDTIDQEHLKDEMLSLHRVGDCNSCEL